MELLIPDTADVIAAYEHYNWNTYAAITENQYGDGRAYYIGCMFDEKNLQKLFKDVLKKAGISSGTNAEFPLIVRKGKNKEGKEITFYLNYSEQEQELSVSQEEQVLVGQNVIEPWGVCVTEK